MVGEVGATMDCVQDEVSLLVEEEYSLDSKVDNDDEVINLESILAERDISRRSSLAWTVPANIVVGGDVIGCTSFLKALSHTVRI